MTKRKGLSKKTHFEVFKRDSFTCQYCGREAPDVVLNADHILPVKEGGSDDITNLVTACQGCNSGKGARTLSDNTAVRRQKRQLDALQQRREQIEMMVKWHRSLLALDEDNRLAVEQFWDDLVPGYALEDAGRERLLKQLKEFGLNEVLTAMRVAARQYLRYDQHSRHPDTPAPDSVEKMLDYIGRICEVNRRTKDNPGLRRLYYARGILRNRLGYCNQWLCMELMEAAVDRGAPIDDIESLSKRCGSWSHWRGEIEAMPYAVG